jgi:hypothetical protein
MALYFSAFIDPLILTIQTIPKSSVLQPKDEYENKATSCLIICP